MRAIRRATVADAAGCLDVYAPYVRETTATFETEVPPVAPGRASRTRPLACRSVGRRAGLQPQVGLQPPHVEPPPVLEPDPFQPARLAEPHGQV